MNDTPQDLQQLLELFQNGAGGRWGIWRVEADGRALYFGRKLYHPNGERLDPAMKQPFWKAETCIRCGHGHSFAWPPRPPTAYEALRWVTLCLQCLGFYVGLWPEIFPNLRLGVRAPTIQDFRPPIVERFGYRQTYPLRAADWWRLPPFADGREGVDPWMGSRPLGRRRLPST